MSGAEMAALDAHRGSQGRAEYLRTLLWKATLPPSTLASLTGGGPVSSVTDEH